MRACPGRSEAKVRRLPDDAQDRRDTRARQESLGVFEETTRATGAGAQARAAWNGAKGCFPAATGAYYLPPSGATIQAP